MRFFRAVGKVATRLLVVAGIILLAEALQAPGGGIHGSGNPDLTRSQFGLALAWSSAGLLFTIYGLTHGFGAKLTLLCVFVIGIATLVFALAAQPFARMGADVMDLFLIGYVGNLVAYAVGVWFLHRCPDLFSDR